MKRLIVVISGKKGSGKNTAANQIVAQYLNKMVDPLVMPWSVDNLGLLRYRNLPVPAEAIPFRVAFLSFAAPIKHFCMDVLGLTHDQCWGTDDDKNTLTKFRWDNVASKHGSLRQGFMTARDVMQVFGTDLMRTWHPDVWAEACAAMAVKETVELTLITDCRFPNEVDVFRKIKGQIADCDIWLIRLLRSPYNDQHPSETALDTYPLSQFDLVVPDHPGVAAQGEYLKDFIDARLRLAGLVV
jgi:hypothetical protein